MIDLKTIIVHPPRFGTFTFWPNSPVGVYGIPLNEALPEESVEEELVYPASEV